MANKKIFVLLGIILIIFFIITIGLIIWQYVKSNNQSVGQIRTQIPKQITNNNILQNEQYPIKTIADFENSTFCNKYNYNCKIEDNGKTNTGIPWKRYTINFKNLFIEILYNDSNILDVNLMFPQIFYKSGDNLSLDEFNLAFSLVNSFNKSSASDINNSDSIYNFILKNTDKPFRSGGKVDSFDWGDYIVYTGRPIDIDAYSCEVHIVDKSYMKE